MPDEKYKAMLRALAEHYQAGNLPDYGEGAPGPGLPRVPHPTMFQPDPVVVGSPEFVKLAYALINLNPQAKERIKSITAGPTSHTMRRQLTYGEDPGGMPSNALGFYDAPKNEIFVDPNAAERGLPPDEVLAHEIAHAAGHEQEGAQKAEELYRKGKRKK